MFGRILVANRGEIALRVMRTAKRMGYETVAVFADTDRGAPHVAFADVAREIGFARPREAYLNADAILDAARSMWADAIHPGYGFLAESPEFAERCAAAGLTFIGPTPESMRLLGNKAAAKRLLEGSGVPFLPGYHDADQDDETLRSAARAIGVPLMIKAAAGGGGRGMRLVLSEADFTDALSSARSEALASFGNGDLLLERALARPRHVEVQVFADRHGNAIHLGERDCSVQRRHQKLIEEAPSPAVDAALRSRLGDAAVAVARAARYVGAGTVEFLLDEDGSFYFMEVNARLQVEHTVTEAITGLDLVEWQIRVARGEPLPCSQHDLVFSGHAIEARLCAEDPERGFLPQSGTLAYWEAPGGVRVDHALHSGAVISPYFDSMMAKVIAHGPTRDEARRRLATALDACVALGVTTNKRFLASCLRDDTFASGAATTGFVDEHLAHLDFDEEPSTTTFMFGAALLYARIAARGRYGSWTSWSTTARPASTFVLSGGREDASVTLAVVAEGPRLQVAARTATEGRCNVQFEAPVGSEFGTALHGTVRYRMDETSATVAYAISGTTLFLSQGGASYVLRDRTYEPAATAQAAAGDGTLRAPMSARVVAVRANGSERVAAGATVVVLEAMKMEHALKMPRAATIRSVIVREGAQVTTGDALLTYEPAG
jgi:geranyl-CoA carboxylase alpha subunit